MMSSEPRHWIVFGQKGAPPPLGAHLFTYINNAKKSTAVAIQISQGAELELLTSLQTLKILASNR